MFFTGLCIILFGLLVGWISYRALRATANTRVFSELAPLLGVIAGAVIIVLFRDDLLFDFYTVGLILGFLAYLAAVFFFRGKQAVLVWLVGDLSFLPASSTTPTPVISPDPHPTGTESTT